jgi:ribosomal protein S14
MKHLILKDRRRRVLFSFFEKRRLFLKAIIHDKDLPKSFRVLAYRELLFLPKDSSITRIRTRCILTNRPRAVYKKFGLSRLMFRKHI